MGVEWGWRIDGTKSKRSATQQQQRVRARLGARFAHDNTAHHADRPASCRTHSARWSSEPLNGLRAPRMSLACRTARPVQPLCLQPSSFSCCSCCCPALRLRSIAEQQRTDGAVLSCAQPLVPHRPDHFELCKATNHPRMYVVSRVS